VLVLLYYAFAKLLGGKATLRSSLALLAYSLVPIVLSLFLVLPIELLTFGMYLFTSNPHPYVLKPFSYLMLVGFDAVVTAWSIFLVIIGGMVAHRLTFAKSALAAALTLGVVCGAFILGSQRVVW
jgi:hypothetical protein